MIRRHRTVPLNRSGWNAAASDGVDPNSSLTNIADCMLVLMLGLLVALVAHYDIDLVPQDDKAVGIEVNMDANADGVIDGNYTSAGTVYLDEETGNYYWVEE